jgi:hypothetical protein
MAVISIASATLANWELSNDVVLRIYALESFVSADGDLNAAGVPSQDATQNNNFFEQVTCTLSGTTLTIAACTLESTTDSLDNPSAKYGAYFFTNEGQNLGAFGEFACFMLPAAPTSTTWEAIAVAQGEAQ